MTFGLNSNLGRVLIFATGSTAQIAMQLWFKFNGTDWVIQNQRFNGSTYTIPNDICSNLSIEEVEKTISKFTRIPQIT